MDSTRAAAVGLLEPQQLPAPFPVGDERFPDAPAGRVAPAEQVGHGGSGLLAGAAAEPSARGGEVPAGPRTPSLSPSRASDFLACPLRYRFRVIDRLPEPAHPEAVRGTVVHAVLERLFELPGPERTLALARTMVAAAWEQVRSEDPRAAELAAAGEAPMSEPSAASAADEAAVVLPGWLSSAGDLLGTYFGLEDPTRVEPAERELRVETVLDTGLRLRGFVDRLDVAPDGAVRIVDYKTGRSPGEGFEARALFQMRFYALVVWRLRGVIPALLQLMYLGDGTVVRYAPDEADLLATERKVRAVWDAVEVSMQRRDFRPNPGRLCDWCDHKVRCPAFGGVAPPYPEPVAADPGAAAVAGGAGADAVAGRAGAGAADTGAGEAAAVGEVARELARQ